MRRLGLVCAALMLLTACDRSPTPIEPAMKPSASGAKRTPDAASTLKPPELPAAAKRNDATGAANFVDYWVKVSNYAAHTGDTEMLRKISDPACETCNRYAELYEKTYDAGGYFRGGTQTLRSVTAEKGSTEFFFLCELQTSAGTYKRTRQSNPAITKPETSKAVFAVRRDGSSWQMTQIGPEPR